MSIIYNKSLVSNYNRKKINSNDKNNTEYYLTDEGKSLKFVIYELIMYAINKDKNNQIFTEEEKKYLKVNAKRITEA